MRKEADGGFDLASLANRERRSVLADAVLLEKDRLLQTTGFSPGYQGEIQYTGEGYLFTNPQKILEATRELASAVKAYSTIRSPNNSEKYFVGLNAAVVVLAELQILGPEILYKSQQQHETGVVKRVGIQKEQVEAALAIEMMDSAKVPSSQGKSYTDIPIAAVVRALFTGEQVHIMVRDPQAKKRDADNLRRLTSALNLNLGVIDRSEQSAQPKKRIKELVFMSDVIDFAAGLSQSEKEEFKRQRRKEIDQLIKEVNFSFVTGSDQSPVLSDDKGKKETDIIIGDDKDFVFTSMTDQRKFVWDEKKACVICDEGDLPWTKGSPYELENRVLSTLSSYLPEWITSCVVDEVCTALRKEGKITPDANNQLDFIDTLGDETLAEYEKQVRFRLELVAKDGTLQDRYMQTLRIKIAGEFEGLMKTIPVQAYSKKLRERKAKYFFTYDSMRKLVKRYAYQDVSAPAESEKLDILHPADPIAFFDHAWLTAQKLTPGINYSRSDHDVVIIDQETGHPLPTHQYSGLIDMAVDVKEGVCSFRGRSDEVLDRTGFQMFLQKNYGKGHISLVSATLDHIRGEIEEFTGGKVVDIGYWIGEEMPVPQIEISEDFEKAQNRLLEIIHESSLSGRPVEIVCDNDEELEALKQILEGWNKETPKYQINMVISKSSLEHEEKIFGQAGQLNTITLTNSRGGRMVNIKTSKETNDAGGLLLVVWGALKNKAVLRQVLARTARTGAPGETRWLVYRHGGKASLIDHPLVKRFGNYRAALNKISDGQTLDYDYSLLEKIHNRNDQEDRSTRLFTYAYDELRFFLYNQARKSLTDDIGDIATQGYIEEYIQVRWHDVIDFIADEYISQLSRYKMDTIGDLFVSRGTVLNDPHFTQMLDKYANTLLVDSHNHYVRDPESGELRTRILNHIARLAPDIKTYLQFKDAAETDRLQQSHLLSFLPPLNPFEPLRAGLYFPQNPDKLYILTRNINLLAGSLRQMEAGRQVKISLQPGYGLRVMTFDEQNRYDGDMLISVSESDIEELLSQVFYTDNVLKQRALFNKLRKNGILPL